MGIYTKDDCLTEITALGLAIQDIKDAIVSKGVEVPEDATVSELADYISQITTSSDSTSEETATLPISMFLDPDASTEIDYDGGDPEQGLPALYWINPYIIAQYNGTEQYPFFEGQVPFVSGYWNSISHGISADLVEYIPQIQISFTDGTYLEKDGTNYYLYQGNVYLAEQEDPANPNPLDLSVDFPSGAWEDVDGESFLFGLFSLESTGYQTEYSLGNCWTSFQGYTTSTPAQIFPGLSGRIPADSESHTIILHPKFFVSNGEKSYVTDFDGFTISYSTEPAPEE